MDRRYAGGDVDLTSPVSLRSGMKGNFHVPFWRAAALVRESLTLIWNAARNILEKGLSTAGHAGTNASGETDLYLSGEIPLSKSTRGKRKPKE